MYTHKGELFGRRHGEIAIDGLWALEFGNNGNAGHTNELFFTAGPNDESQASSGK